MINTYSINAGKDIMSYRNGNPYSGRPEYFDDGYTEFGVDAPGDFQANWGGYDSMHPGYPPQSGYGHTRYGYPPQSRFNKVFAAILSLVGFFGVAGLHRLYVGRIISGVIWFLTFGFFGIGTVVDLILILTGRFKDNTGLHLR